MKNLSHWLCITGGVVGLLASAASAQAPVFKIWVTEVYDGDFVPQCGSACPTQNLPEGVATWGDYINIEITVEGWDAEPDRGICDLPTEECSVSAQDCAYKHCQNSGAFCYYDSDCGPGEACVPDVCHMWPRVCAYQWTLDSSGFWNGSPDPGLQPAEIPCAQDEDCWCAYDEECSAGAEFGKCTCCEAICDPVSNTCSSDAAVYIDQSNSDFIFLTTASIAVVCSVIPDYEAGAVILTWPGALEFDPDTGASSPYYVGTLLLQATADATGTFLIDLRQVPAPHGGPGDTFLIDDTGAKLPTPIVEWLTINFGDLSADDDQDGIVNGEDNCPDVSNSDQADCDGDGEGDACEAAGDDRDDDGDGTCNGVDGCPNDPNKTAPGICGCGIPDTGDADDDGILDCLDQCPGVDDGLFAPECSDAIPTVSEWGVLILALLLLAAGKVYFSRRRAAGRAA